MGIHIFPLPTSTEAGITTSKLWGSHTANRQSKTSLKAMLAHRGRGKQHSHTGEHLAHKNMNVQHLVDQNGSVLLIWIFVIRVFRTASAKYVLSN